jgi:hypothetical protein
VPNAIVEWNSNIERLTVHLIKEVAKGQEITISYCDREHTFRGGRWQKMNDNYHFECSCNACLNPTKSDRRRNRIRNLMDTIEVLCRDAPGYPGDNRSRCLSGSKESSIPDPDKGRHTARARQSNCFSDCMELILELIQIEEEEHSLPQIWAYRRTSSLCKWKSDFPQAVAWAEKELESKIASYGVDSPKVEQAKTYIASLEEEAWTDTSSEVSEGLGSETCDTQVLDRAGVILKQRN